MAKRLTDTAKWDKEWFMDLSPEKKLLWLYLCDNCDHAGIWERNFKLASLHLGFTITEKTVQAFGDKVIQIESDKYFVRSFISFQYGVLTETNNAHKAVITRLKKYGIDPNSPGAREPLMSPSQGAQDKEKDKSFSPPVFNSSSSPQEEGECKGEETKPDQVALEMPDKPEHIQLRREIWESYSKAYRMRYKTDPVRNSTVNSQIKSLAKRLGGEAPAVAEFFVQHNKGFYVGKCHPIGLCLSDAEALRTQWARGRALTQNDVRAFEQQDAFRSQMERIERGEL